MIEIIRITLMLIMLVIGFMKCNECEELKRKLDIQKTENKSLRRVLFENDLIPEEFVK